MTKFKIALLAVFAFVSCEDPVVLDDDYVYDPQNTNENNDNNNDNNNTNSEASFTAEVDGNSFTGINYSASIVNGLISITGENNGEVITLSINDSQEGDYIMNGVVGMQSHFGGYTHSPTESGYVGIDFTGQGLQVGSVSVTNIDETNQTISGTFDFVATRYAMDAQGDFLTDPNTGDFVLETIAINNGSFINIPYTTDIQGNNGNSSSFEAIVDGVAFENGTISGVAFNQNGFSSITLAATTNNTETLSLMLDLNIAAGTYTLQALGFSLPTASYVVSNTESYGVTTGEVTITSHDTTNQRIIGTFYFDGANVLNPAQTISVTSGSFDITYQ